MPLFGVAIVNGKRGCQCLSQSCKERDHGKHAFSELMENLAKDGGKVFLPEEFDDGANVALWMGPQPNGTWLVALDADGPFDWSRLGPLPPTRTQKSPRGEHRIFTVAPYTPLGNWVKALESPGAQLDLRYARGRIVVAPSVNAFGQYRWTDERMPVELPKSAIDVILRERRRRGLPVQSRWERSGKSP